MFSKFGIIICSRTDSSRIPNKVFAKINGVPLIEHLINRINKLDIQIYLAIPKNQLDSYLFLKKYPNVNLFPSEFKDDPLARMNECAQNNNIQHIIRITHDKILINEKDIKCAIIEYTQHNSDYLYSNKFIEGTSFEIISSNLINKASLKYKNIEFISYPIRELCQRSYLFKPRHPLGDYRFLIDYVEDLKLFELLFSQLGNNANVFDCVEYLNKNVTLKKLNMMPKLTIYTCVLNGSEFIERAMKSVMMQKSFKDYEYIIIDDCSTDNTFEIINKFAIQYSNVKILRNQKNIGLASSSNIALINARGKYIVRLDADDFFTSIDSCSDLINKIEESDYEAIYPDNYYGEYNTIQKGNQEHHVGGAIFERKSINYIKFMDGLRHYEGLDFFSRAKDRIKINYLYKPIFFYTQREGSLSKTDIKQRKKIKDKIESEYGLDEYSIEGIEL